MNIRIPYIMNPVHEVEYITTIIKKNGSKVVNKKANIICRGLKIRPITIIYENDIFV